MLKLKKRGRAGIYQIIGTVGGTHVRESTGTNSRPHAEAILAKREVEILDRAVWGSRRTSIFAEAVEHYLNVGGEARFLERLLDRWGTWKIADITDVEVAKAAHDLYPGRTAAYHVRAVYTPLQACLNAAAKAKLCDPVTFSKPKIKFNPVEYARPEWFEQTLPHMQMNLAALLVFISTTGARVQEACDLMVGDVDLDRMVAVLARTKTGRSREVPIIDLLRDPFAALMERAGKGKVFGLANRHSVNQAIGRACRRAGTKYYSSHKVGRHTFAARLLGHGKSLKAVQDGGSWSSGRMVTQTYGHLEARDLDMEIRRIGGDTFSGIPLGRADENKKFRTKPDTLQIGPPEKSEDKND
jgi:integrase